MLFAHPDARCAEYHNRADGSRVGPHDDDCNLYRVITKDGDCVQRLRKLQKVFRMALKELGMTIDQACDYLQAVLGEPAPNLEGQATILLGLKDFLYDEAVRVRPSKVKALDRTLMRGTMIAVDGKRYMVSPAVADAGNMISLYRLGRRICAAMIKNGIAERADLERILHRPWLRRLPDHRPVALPSPASPASPQ